MTKKHFNALASHLKDAKPTPADYQTDADYAKAHSVWAALVRNVCWTCASTNDAFQPQRFRDACGL